MELRIKRIANFAQNVEKNSKTTYMSFTPNITFKEIDVISLKSKMEEKNV